MCGLWGEQLRVVSRVRLCVALTQHACGERDDWSGTECMQITLAGVMR